MSAPETALRAATAAVPGARDNFRALIVMTTIFFMWGFITELNDVLIPHLKAVFTLNYAQAMSVQLCFFGAYLVMAIPAGAVVARVGYKLGIVFGLLVAGAGALSILIAAERGTFELFLPALFVLASGIVLLQVAANPYVALLGPPLRAPSRLNFAQAINSLGHTIGPWVGGALIFAATALSAEQLALLPAAQRAQTVQPLYLGVALALIALALLIFALRLPAHREATEQADPRRHTFGEALALPAVRYGVLAIFLYVGAEVAIGSFLASYAMRPDIGAVPGAQVGGYVSLYWFAAMIGRFCGAALLLAIDARRLLALYAMAAIALMGASAATHGAFALGCAIAVGFCNSIMFPTVFTLVIDRLGALTQRASSLLVMAIFGGAVIPKLQGLLVDAFARGGVDETAALQYAFALPAMCYAYIAWYVLRGARRPVPPPAARTGADA